MLNLLFKVNMTKVDRPCNVLSGVTIPNFFTPLIPRLKKKFKILNILFLKILCNHGLEVVYLVDKLQEMLIM